MDGLLSSQRPLSEAHDEMLFIVQHQTSELWMRLILHELNGARDLMLKGQADVVFKMLARVARIFEQLNNAWDVLRTMTPSEYTTFRETLGNSSGFQSHQYRLIEYALGNRNTNLMKVHEHDPALYHVCNYPRPSPSRPSHLAFLHGDQRIRVGRIRTRLIDRLIVLTLTYNL